MGYETDTRGIPPTFSREKFRAHRLVRGLTRSELARRANLSASTIVAYEYGRSAPSSAALGRIVAALGVDVSALYTTSTEPAGEYWPELLAMLPPMTDSDIADLAAVVHRIDARQSVGAEL